VIALLFLAFLVVVVGSLLYLYGFSTENFINWWHERTEDRPSKIQP
jgi:hypothetical protein